MSESDKSKAAKSQQARPPQDESPNVRFRKLAHERLDQLFNEAERSHFWGTVGIETTWENGVVRLLHRRMDGRDKA